MYDTSRIHELLSQRREGFMLPQPFYNEAQIFEFDMDAIFKTSWIFVAFDIELPKVGSYLAMSIGRTPIVLVRGRDGLVRGFFNTCRHRGAQLCSDGKGRAQRIVCPYHQWSFDLDGRLAVARGMNSDFEIENYGLIPIRVESVEGTIYVCLSDSPPDFAPFRDAFAPLVAPYRLKDAKIAAEQIILEKANWKLAMENARECAHCAVGHPDLCLTLVDFFTLDYENEQDPHLVEYARRLKESGRPVGAVEGDWFSTGHMPLKPGKKSITMDGDYVVQKHLMSEPGLGALRWTLQPHCYNVGLQDYIFTFSAIPVSAEETLIHSKWLVHGEAIEGVDYSVDELQKLWKVTNEQDVVLTERNQRGVNSIGYRPGPYIEGAESGCQKFADWYCAEAHEYLRKAEPDRAAKTAA
ncbi:aromatic ring-hydroxylating oxygenase subunit alpha [Labrys okinawensis]|uniref:aromatic ring-hydroxylating oxygenase subunit alpha n=1 Tax=Labrys okinawensis TaxID=346911 RepID=UPI0039BC2C8D